MPLRTLPFEPQRPAMLAEAVGRSWIDALGQVQRLGVLLRSQPRQYSLRSKRRLMQPHTHRVVDGIGNRGNRRRQ